jgi:ABC-type polysaccharide/polyol phosphate transport system ATPase subunit
MSIIRVEHVSKVFRQKVDRRLLRDHLRQIVSRRSEADGFHVLTDISFTVQQGESVALVGANGAGKSTLLALICGLAQPDAGRIEIDGQVAAMLEFASGFHHDLTGRENVMLNAAFLGLNRRQAHARFPDIAKFAEIGEFIDQPVRTYSAGMTMRLGFAAAVHCSPDVIIIDEVLGVGDQAFQAKCLERIQQMRAEGRTLLCVSHSPATVRSLCGRSIRGYLAIL